VDCKFGKGLISIDVETESTSKRIYHALSAQIIRLLQLMVSHVLSQFVIVDKLLNEMVRVKTVLSGRSPLKTKGHALNQYVQRDRS